MAKPNSQVLTGKKFPLSYSKADCFRQCPHKFEKLHVEKSVMDTGSDATRYGERVHKSLERYGKSGDPSHLTRETEQWKGIVDNILRREGEKFFELKMAIDADHNKVEWFSKKTWFRAIADVLIIDGETAYYVDWKTGKVKDDMTQLMISAAMVFFLYPQVKTVKGAFVWLAYDQVTGATYNREHLDVMWERLCAQFDKVQEAIDLGVFEAKPSRLCNWCAAQDVCIYK